MNSLANHHLSFYRGEYKPLYLYNLHDKQEYSIDKNSEDKDGYKKNENPEEIFNAITPALRLLSDPKLLELGRRFVTSTHFYGLSDAELMSWKEWNINGENIVLLMISSMCRIGLIQREQDNWSFTNIKPYIVKDWDNVLPIDNFRDILVTKQSPHFTNAFNYTMNNFWSILYRNKASDILNFISTNSTGVSHENILNHSNSIHQESIPNRKNRDLFTLNVLSAASGIGAIWFNGWKWEPTLYGLWLTSHNESHYYMSNEL